MILSEFITYYSETSNDSSVFFCRYFLCKYNAVLPPKAQSAARTGVFPNRHTVDHPKLCPSNWDTQQFLGSSFVLDNSWIYLLHSMWFMVLSLPRSNNNLSALPHHSQRFSQIGQFEAEICEWYSPTESNSYTQMTFGQFREWYSRGRRYHGGMEWLGLEITCEWLYTGPFTFSLFNVSCASFIEPFLMFLLNKKNLFHFLLKITYFLNWDFLCCREKKNSTLGRKFFCSRQFGDMVCKRKELATYSLCHHIQFSASHQRFSFQQINQPWYLHYYHLFVLY